ncbi:MAG: hypothetical protein H7A45_07775 [Verrucomicrobiales bacterium]|nr:hypothetical protein [Verrucomicrobiales bacterium]MCP5527127.1 hypothetical protein [Verrucomicrobiales bacterium]
MKKRRVNYATIKDAPAAGLREATAAGAEAMVRTQVYLTVAEHRFLSTEAERRGEPMAAVLRSFIDERMEIPDAAWERNSLLDPPADPGFLGPEDGVINHDHYLHGGPKKWVKQGGQWVEAPPLPADYHANPESAAAYDRLLEEMA